MAQGLQGGAARAALTLAALVIAAGLAASCSSSSAPPPELVEQQDSKLTSCGTPYAIHTTADAATHVTVSPAANLFVPSTVQATGAMWYTPTTISAWVKFGAVTCLYSSSVPQAASVDLAFASCSGGVTPGTSVFMSTVEFWGTMNGYTGTAGLDVALGRSLVDPIHPCIINTCLNGVITPTNAPEGTGCDDGNVCNGMETCTAGTCTPSSGAALPTDDGDPCTTDTACVPPSTLPTHTPISGCGVPSGAPSAYPGNASLPSDFAGGAAFLYPANGNDPLKMDSKRIAIVRGRVIDGTTVPPPVPAVVVPGATVTILGHSEYGTSTTNSDGYFDLAVNGGDTFTVQIVKAGYPTVQRKVATRWLDFSVLPDIAMVQLDPANVVNLDDNKTTGNSWQTARGSLKTDADGSRRATLLIPPGTTVSNWTPTGSTLNFRATEFTVGTNGPAAMPADLPATSAYTYALDLSIDEATQPTTTFANAYANSVIFYVEHFVGPSLNTLTPSFPVPSGYYDRAAGIWKPESSGRIVRILSANGTAVLSLDGTNPMTAQNMTDLGITTGELQLLATAPLYAGATNKDLWRVRMPHFTPYDCNWSAGLESTARPPPEAAPRADTPEPNSCVTEGSIIECENQVLGESLPIAGTPFSLNYRSETQNGYHPTITVPISDENANDIPLTYPSGSFDHGEVEIVVAGKRALLTFGRPAKNQRLEWTWDRTDAYGRAVQGTTTAHVKVSYVYRAVNSNYTSDFGKFGTNYSFGLSRSARTISLEKNFDVSVGGLDAKALGLGGWTLSANHVFETSTRTAWLGTGEKRDPRAFGEMISTAYLSNLPGTFRDAAVAGDGSVYLGHTGTSTGDAYLAALGGSGFLILSSTSNTPNFADDAPLIGVHVNPLAVIVGPDDYIYVAEYYRIIKVNRATQHAYLVAGTRTPSSGTSPDGTIAAGSPLNVGDNTGQGAVASITFGADGLLYFPDGNANAATGARLRRIRSDGTLETVGGNMGKTGVPSGCNTTNTCRALDQPFWAIEALASDPQGGIYLYDRGGYRVWRMAGDNTLRLVAGTGNTGSPLGDGGPALSANLAPVVGIAFSRGALYLSCSDLRVRRVAADGTITTVAGNGTGVEKDLVAATSSGITGDGGGGMRVVQGPDGYFILADGPRVRRFGIATDPVVGNNTLVMSPDGNEIYAFNSGGQHVSTLSPFRGATHYTFTNGDANRLTSVTDGFASNATVLGIAYSPGSVAITSQFGRLTTLTLDSNGYLASITNPNTAEVIHVTHSATGLLLSLTDALTKVHTFSYTPSGLLSRDKNAFPNTSGVSLTRNTTDRSFSVLVTSPEGRGTLHTVDLSRPPVSPADPLRVELRTHVDPVGVTSSEIRRKDGSRTVTYPQLAGQTNTVADALSPDPRFSIGSAYLSSRVAMAGASPKTSTINVVRTTVPPTMTDPSAVTQVKDDTSFSATGADTLGHVIVQYDKVDSSTSTVTTSTLAGQVNETLVIETLDDKDRVLSIAPQGTAPCTSPCTPATLVPTVLGYDAGRLATLTQTGLSATRTVTAAFNAAGWVTSVTTPLGVVHYDANMDAMGRPWTVTLPGNRQVLLQYDLNGNATKVTTPMAGGRDHSFMPNSLDLLGTYGPPSSSPGGSTAYTYDADSLLLSRAEPQATMVYSRDIAGRVTGVTYPTSTGSTESVSTTYDSAGHVSTVNSSLGPTLSYIYDGDMVTTETSGGTFGHILNKTYDNYQRLTDRKIDNVAANNAHFTYDTHGRISQITGASSTFAMNRATGNGLLSDTTLTVGGNWVKDYYDYTEFGEVKRYHVDFYDGSATRTIYDVTYTRNQGPGLGAVTGRLDGKTETIGASTAPYSGYPCSAQFHYDSRNFLSDQTGTCPWGGAWSYDDDGNNTTYGTSFDLQDRLVANGGTAYGYDADGDTTSISGGTPWNYFYDAPGNLRRVTGPTPNLDYVVDGLNRRRGFLQNGSPVQGYIWDGARIVGMEKTGYNVVGHYIYASKSHVPDLMYAPQESGVWKAFRIISDPLGSVKMVIRVDRPYASSVFEWHDYSTWGIPIVGGGAQFGYVPFGFAGGLYDTNTGIYRFGARDYMPWSARWWSKDPIRFGGGDPNLYAYCANDPVNRIDPSGRLLINVAIYVAAYFFYDDLFSTPMAEAQKEYPGDGAWGGRQDAYRHCLASCRATAKYGAGTAKACGWANEHIRLASHTERDDAMDVANNAAGQDLGATSSAEQCRTKCIGALDSGRLDLMSAQELDDAKAAYGK